MRALRQLAEGPYRGPDRRRRNAAACGLPRPGRALAYTGLLCGCGGLPALFFAPRPPSAEVLVTYAVAAAGFFALLAGVSALVSWRVLGRVAHAWYGGALIGLGLLTLAEVGLAGTSAGAPSAQSLDAVVVTFVAGGLLWSSIADCEVNAGFALLPTLAVWCGGGLLAIGALHESQLSSILPPAGTALAEVVPTAIAAAAWLVVATATVRRERASGQPVGWRGVVAGLFGIAAVLASLRPVSPTAFPLAAAVLTFVTTSLALGVEMTRLDVALRNEEGRQRDLFRTLRAAQRQTRLQGEQLEEWVHDLRNAVAGLRSIDAILRGGYDRDLADRMAITDAVSAELTRLETLVDPARGLRPSEIALADVLAPAITAERAAGAAIDVGGVGLRAWADADALSRVVQNVLVNARRYAPGSAIRIWADACADQVELRVHDHGPGIEPAEREAVFDRGARGSASRGTGGDGLGLYVARRLVRAMGGDLRVDPRVQPGCCLLITLPLAARGAQTRPVVTGSGWKATDPLEAAV